MRLAIAVLLVLVGACTRPATELVVQVESDIPRSELTSVHASVMSLAEDPPDGGGNTAHYDFDLHDGGVPFSFAVVPRHGDPSQRVRITASTMTAGGLVSRSATLGFVAGGQPRLTLFLASRCEAVLCPSGTTCDPGSGICTDDMVDVTLLPPLDGGDAAETDAGARDLGGLDAGMDAGTPDAAACTPTACAWGRCIGDVCDDAVELSAAGPHTCARRAGGSVVCWGSNTGGALGDGTTTERHTPVEVLGISDAISVAAGDGPHTCVVRAGGAVECWGFNGTGQLGDGTTTDRSVAVPAAVADAVQLALGNHTCARRLSGAVACWGNNRWGQLGDGTNMDRHSPVAVLGATGALSLAAGWDHTCALTASGAICWGENGSGQLGDGTTMFQTTPVAASGSTDWVELAAGQTHTCARRSSGAVVCWGANNQGLGDGTTTSSLVPVAVSGISDAVEIESALHGACARHAGGAVSCWGTGPLGDGTTASRQAPVAVSGLSDALEIACGYFHCCARRASGEVVCWGLNSNGQLGDGTTTDGLVPTPVIPP